MENVGERSFGLVPRMLQGPAYEIFLVVHVELYAEVTRDFTIPYECISEEERSPRIGELLLKGHLLLEGEKKATQNRSLLTPSHDGRTIKVNEG